MPALFIISYLQAASIRLLRLCAIFVLILSDTPGALAIALTWMTADCILLMVAHTLGYGGRSAITSQMRPRGIPGPQGQPAPGPSIPGTREH